jgi:ABC-2 type transport system permease protein
MKHVDTGRFSRFIIYLVVVVLLNIAGITLFFRADLTANQVYSLSAASRNVVATLSEPLTVKVFFSSNLPAPYNNIERYLHDLLEEYAVAGKNYFNYEFYDISGEADEKAVRNQDLAENYGIHPVQIQNIEQDEVKFQKAYMGMVLIHGDVIETIPTITSTEGLEYQITSSIQKMNNKISALLRLKKPVAVKLFLSSSLRAVGPYLNITGLSGLPEKVKEMVKKLNVKNYGKLTFTYIDPGVSPGAAAEADKYHILKLNWDEFTDRRGQRIPADSGYAGIVVEHDGEFEVVKLIEVIRLPIFGTQYQLTDMDGLDKTIDEMVENVININEEIGYLAGHGTLPLGSAVSSMFGREQDDSISNLNKLLSQRYSIKQVDLKKGGIPDGLSFLMIAGPKEKFSDYELYQIDQFLMQGKTLALFLDSFNEVMPRGQQGMMQFQRPVTMPLNTGLDKLLAHYGITVKKSVVLDENSFKQRVPRAFGGGERQIYYAPIIKNENINKNVAFLENIKGLILLKATPLAIDETKIKDEGLRAVKLFSSSDRSWEMKGRVDFNPMLMSPPRDKDAFKSMPLAYIVEGPFSSYFADKQVPEKKEEKGKAGAADSKAKAETKQERTDMSAVATEGATIKKGRPGRIFIIGTSGILQDNVVDEEGKTPNAQFVMNVIDSLNGNEDIAVMRSKTQEFNPLKEVSPAVKTTIKTANIAGLPVLVIIAGILVWFRRAARKRMIQRKFAK